MKYELPVDHGLSGELEQHLLFRDASGGPAVSDVQYEALAAGVARGESVLVVSPTSTGKTQIALWAIAGGLERGCNTVYLVTHRALAKQKFEDFRSQLLGPFLGDNAASLVVATGDYVEDAEGIVPSEPLRAPLLVATYEKYLALLSASGAPKDMRNTVVVCDEIQLIGDFSRGQNVEVLLTLLRNAGWKQFVGLSAVLQQRDANDLANWLKVKLVALNAREKHLRYECWTEGRMVVVNSDKPDQTEEASLPAGVTLDPIAALMSLLGQQDSPRPVIVFCMKKQDTYDLARRFVETAYKGQKGQMSLAFDGLPATSANEFLAGILERRVACHTADLTDEERHVVETYLLDGRLDVVFATSTLAAGVNFPLGAAVFAGWSRWDSDLRTRVPMETSDFHNMAGRVGRMGFAHERGRVVFFASTKHELAVASKYLALGELPLIEPRVQPQRFSQLALQLVASGLCVTQDEVERLVCSSFSALREEDRNTVAFRRWPELLKGAVAGLVDLRFVVSTSTGRLAATPLGKAIGHSGLLPETGVFLLRYLVNKANALVQLLPSAISGGDTRRLAFLLFSACLASPEFRPQGGMKPTRTLPYPLDAVPLVDADGYSADLAEPMWNADIMPINGTWLSCEWLDGVAIRTLEGTLENLRAGMLHELFRNLGWALQGMAEIAAAACDKRVPQSNRPVSLHVDDGTLNVLARLPRAIRRLSYRLTEGLPDDVLWMVGLSTPGSPYQLRRDEVLALREVGLTTPEALMLGSQDADAARVKALAGAKQDSQAKANWLRDACRSWKSNQRVRAAERQARRAKKCPRADFVERFYHAAGNDFERVFEDVLAYLKVDCKRLDDKTKTGAPDYLIQLPSSPPLVVELKSREAGKLIDYNRAVEVLAASEVHGYKDAFCVTLCQPGVDPSVPTVIASCERLSVIEAVDLGEALLRYCEGTLSGEQLYRWLATPGQSLIADLPYREYA
ncbi:DEAD/DEAH box helicase [Pandoraea commovens]|uniref:Putative helicase HelY n=1 Tax=Pandoraea commovens TaxID=2508289 RepID=A0A5E4RIB5_9BURK|nr:DEAD/DEAH box helicase [Pandoraea commovens]VVD62561.1 putative helicase HelY [Pandoraea commovens]